VSRSIFKVLDIIFLIISLAYIFIFPFVFREGFLMPDIFLELVVILLIEAVLFCGLSIWKIGGFYLGGEFYKGKNIIWMWLALCFLLLVVLITLIVY
jgi:hypothetical protein